MLRIGYDARQLYNNFTGPGSYSRTLLSNLAEYFPDNAYFLYTPHLTKNEETQFFLNSALYNTQLPRRRGAGLIWQRFGIKRDLKRQRIQLFHGLNQALPFGMSKTDIKSVVTVHDLAFKHFPGQYPFHQRLALDLQLKYACQEADHIVAISENTRQDLLRFYEVSPGKVSVIYQSCHERYMQERSNKTLETVRKRYNLPKDYILSVGMIIPRKNLSGVIRALSILPEEERLPLVIVGKGPKHKQQIQRLARQSGLGDCIHFVNVGFNDLPAVYQNASLFVYPSFYEGFGIPILEALFSKVPVLASNTSSLPEAGGPGAHLVDPNQPEQIAEGIRKMLTDTEYQERLVNAGFEHAQQFRGEPLAEKMIDLYEDLIGEEYLMPEQIT
ncbi:MAG: glycosyltransferase family 1 protein [Phaeodactylibacter sp.]|uniref:glycosyltransferase family 4 protein n=1 Tax=Phaeodactylibacter sp. TaxID=1940289 RepID=UPI0032ED0255